MTSVDKFSVPVAIALIDYHLDLGLHPDVGVLIWIIVGFWAFPTALYLLYHRVTLPLTSVGFGGVKPNICHNSTLAPGVDGGHEWPCFPSELETRLANVATGPEGWKYLIPERKIIACLVFIALNLGLFAELVLYSASRDTTQSARARHAGCVATGKSILKLLSLIVVRSSRERPSPTGAASLDRDIGKDLSELQHTTKSLT